MAVDEDKQITIGSVMAGIARQAAEANPMVTANGMEPKNIAEIYLCATFAIRAKLTNDDNVSDAVLRIEQGRQLGFGVTQSLQSIAVINKKTVVWGDALPALILSREDLIEFSETWEGNFEDGTLTAVCRVVREQQRKSGKPLKIEREDRFSLSDAAKAGLLGGPVWKPYPKRMLQMRARALAIRNTYADILKGVGVAEEVRDYKELEPERPTPQMPVGTSAIKQDTQATITETTEDDDPDIIDTTATEATETNPDTEADDQPEGETSNGISKLDAIDSNDVLVGEATRCGPLNWDMDIEYPDGSRFEDRVLCMSPKDARAALTELCKQQVTIKDTRGTYPADDPEIKGMTLNHYLNQRDGQDYDPTQLHLDPNLAPEERIEHLANLYRAILNEREPAIHDSLVSDDLIDQHCNKAVLNYIQAMQGFDPNTLTDDEYKKVGQGITELRRPQLFLPR